MTAPLVNCHTHLELGWLADLCPAPPGVPFHHWMVHLIQVRRARREAGDHDALTRRAVEDGIARLHAAGVTHVGDISQTGLSIAPLLASGLAGVVYLEVIGVPDAQWQARFDAARRLLDEWRPRERNGLRLGITLHAPYSLPPQAFETIVPFCLREELPLCIHVAESPYENPLLLGQPNPVSDLARLIGQDPPTPGQRAIPYLEALGVLATQPLLVHMVDVTDDELDRVARSGAKIAHCPRSNSLLQCGRMPLEKVLARGIPVALGTDSLASAPSLDVGEEAAFAQALHVGRVSAESIPPLLTRHDVLT